MIVRVLFFAHLRERAGVREVAIEQPMGASVADLWRTLVERFERLPTEPPRFAVNLVYVDKTHTLHDNDELALIPPVSGG